VPHNADAETPRTDAEPLAFTRSEFLRGARRAWLTVTLLLVGVWILVTVGWGIVAAPVILVASLGALVVGSPGAYLLGRALRTNPHVGRHMALFAVYGGALGAAATATTVAVLGGHDPFAVLLYVVNVPVTALGVAWAWFATARRALRADAPGKQPTAGRRDPDARDEDALDDRYRLIDPRQRPRG